MFVCVDVYKYLYVYIYMYIYIYISKRNRVGDTVANYNLNKLLLTTPEFFYELFEINIYTYKYI